MVLGITSNATSKVSGLLESQEESGESLASMGFFPTVLTYDQFSGNLAGSDYSPNTDEWVNVLRYDVADQERFVIGSKQPQSEEIGKVNIELKATGANTGTDGEVPEDMRVRVGYETANGRASYPVFNYPATRLFNEDVEQRVRQAPKRWALMSDGQRNGIAGSNDRIFISVYANSNVELGQDSVVELPGMLSEE